MVKGTTKGAKACPTFIHFGCRPFPSSSVFSLARVEALPVKTVAVRSPCLDRRRIVGIAGQATSVLYALYVAAALQHRFQVT